MAAGSLARRYARALLALGEQGKSTTLDRLGREIGDLAKAMTNSSELAETLSHPAFPRQERRKILEAILRRLGASGPTKNFTFLLLDRDRLAIIPDVSRELSAMIDHKLGRTSAAVTSATQLSPAQLAKLKQTLESISGKTVELSATEDPALLGGVVAQVGDMLYDGSLRTQLERIRTTLPSGQR